MSRRDDDDEDITEYGTRGHLDWCKECGRDAAAEGDPRDSCDFKNWDECNLWLDGYDEETERLRRASGELQGRPGGPLTDADLLASENNSRIASGLEPIDAKQFKRRYGGKGK